MTSQEEGRGERRETPRKAKDGAQRKRQAFAAKYPELVSGLVRALPLDATTTATIRRESGDPVATRFAQANELARQSAIEQVTSWFPGLDIDDHSRNVDDRGFQVLEIGKSLLCQLDGESTIERILCEHDLAGPRMMETHGELDSRAAPPVRHEIPAVQDTTRTMASVGALASALADGWTTVVNGVDTYDRRASSVNSELERVFGCRVNTNVYLSCGVARGFGKHWDMHDTYIVQVRGSKRWRVYEPLDLSPMRPWTNDDISDQQVFSGELSPGQCLVIPRGWGHEVEGSDELSIHYTIGINRVTATQLLNRAANEAGTRAELRADLPFDPAQSVESFAGSIVERDELRRTFADLASPELIDRAIAAYRARLKRQPVGDLVATIRAMQGDFEGSTVELHAPAGLMYVGRGPRGVRVALQQMVLGVADDAVELVATLADGTPRVVDELPDLRAGGNVRRELLADLARLGLLTVRG